MQYNPLIEEEYDEHFKVTCEYGYDFWKTVTFPFLDVEYAYANISYDYEFVINQFLLIELPLEILLYLL